MCVMVRFSVVLFLAIGFAWGEDFSGSARVIDGDSLFVDDIEVRLHGVDAPEWGQSCLLGDGREYAAGREAHGWLESYVLGKRVSCEMQRIHNGRYISTCYAAGVNINDLLVREGYGFAARHHSRRYMEAEAEARANGRGVWRGKCVKPWIYRRRQKRR